MPVQLFTLPSAAGCPHVLLQGDLKPDDQMVSSPQPLTLSCAPAPCWCASSTTYWASPSGLTPFKDQWFQLVLLYLVGVLHLQPIEPVLEVWLLSRTSGSSMCPCTLLVCFIYNLLSLHQLYTASDSKLPLRFRMIKRVLLLQILFMNTFHPVNQWRRVTLNMVSNGF